MVPQNLTPLTFKNGILVGTGYGYYNFILFEDYRRYKASLPVEEPVAPVPIREPKAPPPAGGTKEIPEIEKALEPPPEEGHTKHLPGAPEEGYEIIPLSVPEKSGLQP